MALKVMAWTVTPMRVPSVVLLSWKNEPVDCLFHFQKTKKKKNHKFLRFRLILFPDFTFHIKQEKKKVIERNGTSVSRSEEERDEIVGEEACGARSFAGFNITNSQSYVCVCVLKSC